MNQELRNQRQREWCNSYLESKRHSILYLCPRSGKIFTTINILETFPKDCKLLIAYPDSNIKDSWITDFKKRGYDNNNITWSTFASLKKYRDEIFDFIILDEIHTLSDNNLNVMIQLLENNKNALGLTGTMNKYTELALKERGMSVCHRYSIQDAISEEIITDYQITILECNLDTNEIKYSSKGKNRTEKQQFDALSWIINKLVSEDKETFHLRLNRMRIIQNSIGKADATINLLESLQNERILVFCGNIHISDCLGIESYHSQSEENTLQQFQNEEFNHLAICKLANTGVTFNKLNKVVINYTDSNSENLCQKILRCMNMDFNNPDKKAEIYIISTNEPVEQKWITKALSFFDKEKIKTIKV